MHSTKSIRSTLGQNSYGIVQRVVDDIHFERQSVAAMKAARKSLKAVSLATQFTCVVASSRDKSLRRPISPELDPFPIPGDVSDRSRYAEIAERSHLISEYPWLEEAEKLEGLLAGYHPNRFLSFKHMPYLYGVRSNPCMYAPSWPSGVRQFPAPPQTGRKSHHYQRPVEKINRRIERHASLSARSLMELQTNKRKKRKKSVQVEDTNFLNAARLSRITAEVSMWRAEVFVKSSGLWEVLDPVALHEELMHGVEESEKERLEERSHQIDAFIAGNIPDEDFSGGTGLARRASFIVAQRGNEPLFAESSFEAIRIPTTRNVVLPMLPVYTIEKIPRPVKAPHAITMLRQIPQTV